MKGQWLGSYQSNTSGRLLIDADELDDGYQAYAVLQPENNALPVVFTRFRTTNKKLPLKFTANLFCLDPRNLEPVVWQDVQQLFPGVTLASNADVTIDLKDEYLLVDWVSGDPSTAGTARIAKSKAGQPSRLKPILINSWQDFKAYVDTLPSNRFAFRGQQSNDWRLRTSFHRTGRSNLERYSLEDIPVVFKHITAQTKHLFNLSDSQQNGAFVSLIQHHGYPTPLLDWTHSPFVAAFFAFRGLRPSGERKVRIFQFALHEWQRVPQLLKLSPLPPHVSILNALAIENLRMLPQQGISTITNVDDMETYIQDIESKQEKTYLQAIDLPMSERAIVSRDLAMMGITAGSLMPGLDGACEQLREQFFPS